MKPPSKFSSSSNLYPEIIAFWVAEDNAWSTGGMVFIGLGIALMTAAIAAIFDNSLDYDLRSPTWLFGIALVVFGFYLRHREKQKSEELRNQQIRSEALSTKAMLDELGFTSIREMEEFQKRITPSSMNRRATENNLKQNSSKNSETI